MTEKELKKLSRNDLLQMLLEQSKELEALKKKYAAAELALRDRQIMLDEAGSIAEAALQLNGVFTAAQAACQQYTDSIAYLSQRQETICAQMEAESRKRAERIVTEAQAKSDEMIQNAKVQSQQYWDTISENCRHLPGSTPNFAVCFPWEENSKENYL